MKRTIRKTGPLVVDVVSVRRGCPYSAQKQTPPEGGPAKAFTVPAHETYTLPNGLKVTLVPYGIHSQGDRGHLASLREAPMKAAVTRAWPMSTTDLLKEGTEKLTSSQLADEAARMGSTLSVNSSYNRTDAELDVLSEFGPDAVRLLADVVVHPRLPESELERLKNDKLRQIALGASAAADRRADALPEDPLRRPSLQCDSARPKTTSKRSPSRM